MANLFIDTIVVQPLSYLAGVLIGIMAYSAGAVDGNHGGAGNTSYKRRLISDGP